MENQKKASVELSSTSAKIACTAPQCKKSLPPEQMWLPEWKALVRANGGQRVTVADFPKFALCGHHGHLLRQSGVKVYRYLDSVRREEARDERVRVEGMAWKPFAERFAPKADGSEKRPNGPRPGRDGRHVGQGLSRCAKIDANQRRSKQRETPPAAEPTNVGEAAGSDGATGA